MIGDCYLIFVLLLTCACD